MGDVARHVCMYVCMYVCVRVCVCIYIYIYIYTHIYMYMYVCMYIYIYIYIHMRGGTPPASSAAFGLGRLPGLLREPAHCLLFGYIVVVVVGLITFCWR